MCGLSVAFVVLPMAIAMGLSQILIVLGLFAALAGCVMFLVVPITLIIYYPKI